MQTKTGLHHARMLQNNDRRQAWRSYGGQWHPSRPVGMARVR